MAQAVNCKTADERVLDAIFNPDNPLGADLECDQELREEQEIVDTAEVRHAKVLEVEAVKAAEEGKCEVALSLLTEAITIAPHCPSPYNNRAQVYRLQNKVDLALADLTMALELSGGRGKAAEQAFTQRGLIHSLHGNNQQARTDFQAAAKLGSTFSQKQLVQMNPYAALCGQMLSEAFHKITRGEQT